MAFCDWRTLVWVKPNLGEAAGLLKGGSIRKWKGDPE
jgi:hypothetical protein